MVPYQNCEIFASILFFILCKILCAAFEQCRVSMYSKRKPTLTSIPERNENEEEVMTTKWVPKKKHEVLKAKYKCLKKLFQIYDASVIGILPDAYKDSYVQEEGSVGKHSRRKKRSHRTKTDACAGTTEVSSGDVSSELEKRSTIATAIMRDLKMSNCSCTSIPLQSDRSKISKFDKYAATHDSKENISNSSGSVRDVDFTQTDPPQPHPLPYLMINEKRRPTRFQIFLQRLFGLRCERNYRNFVSPNGHVYAASDNNISHHHFEKRRRRGLRFRRLRRPKKIQSEIALRDVKSPVILTYVQSVQRNCLLDTTPRQCPILGCRMISYGIINYNDHLNLCHFTERKYICHYCHEGFERECDKFMHENEHIGINKLEAALNSGSSTLRQTPKKASNTQTDPEVIKCNVPEEKLKKIVSFFDKISDEPLMSDVKKNRYSESNLQTKGDQSTISDNYDNSSNNSCNGSENSEKKTLSCVNLRGKNISSGQFDMSSRRPFSNVKCNYCGEAFNNRRQLSLHVDLEHRVHNKFSKFHSCANMGERTLDLDNNRVDLISEDGKINIESVNKYADVRHVNTSSTLTQDTYSDDKSGTVSCDPSTNIVYYSSLESINKKPSVINNLMHKVKNGINNYKWEPGTKIIRV